MGRGGEGHGDEAGQLGVSREPTLRCMKHAQDSQPIPTTTSLPAHPPEISAGDYFWMPVIEVLTARGSRFGQRPAST